MIFPRGAVMRKIDIINLIKTHFDNDDDSFNKICYQIADEFSKDGDEEIARTIYGFVSDAFAFSAQSENSRIGFLDFVSSEENNPLFLPDLILDDIVGVYNAINRRLSINKFLFYGASGTGKTEAAKLLAKKLKRKIYKVSIRDLIDSKLGETAKNIHTLFNDINSISGKNKVVILFDEIDSLALNRSDTRDLREMSRATTELFVGLDNVDPKIVLIATTNLYSSFDSALLLRFQKHINFNRYTNDDLIEIGYRFYLDIIQKVPEVDDDRKLIKKILASYKLPFPGDLKNIISSSIAFSDPANPCDYLSRLIQSLDTNNNSLDMETLQKKGFSLREIAKILNRSKSLVGRRLLDGKK